MHTGTLITTPNITIVLSMSNPTPYLPYLLTRPDKQLVL